MWLLGYCLIVIIWTPPAQAQFCGPVPSPAWFCCVVLWIIAHLRCHFEAKCCTSCLYLARYSLRYYNEQDLVPATGNSKGDLGKGLYCPPHPHLSPKSIQTQHRECISQNSLEKQNW